MTYEPYPCIGGPVDGQTQSMAPGLTRFAVTAQSPGARTQFYRLETIQGEKHEFHLWLHEDVSPDEALVMILERYVGIKR